MDKADRDLETPPIRERPVQEPENWEEDRPKPNEPWSLTTLPRQVALTVIRFYQRAISPLTPPTCRFHPTCSHYTYDAIARFGLARGTVLGVVRLCKCNPFHRGGYDPVPEAFSLWRRPSPLAKPEVRPSETGDASDEPRESEAGES